MNAYRRGNWTPQEDDLMLKLLATHAPCEWNRISDLVQTRSPKQCSERWTQHLRQDLDHSAFTRYECWAIQNLVAQYGTSWALIAQHLSHRSERKIKNWWYNLQQRQKSRAIVQKCTHHLPPSTPSMSQRRRLNLLRRLRTPILDCRRRYLLRNITFNAKRHSTKKNLLQKPTLGFHHQNRTL
ncbi:hypothetical protein D6D13_07596 [Aureobasidium pullulans]|uniref:Myb-like domain-containing protein n=1 Tax=Aureobasidium pullulans TaxID=5580 RepID=A0A4S9CA08_AURPU|nr:hypothetical protein D6D13_07596 [Aureobasidium pullulans]